MASSIEYRQGLGPSSVFVCVSDICPLFITGYFLPPTAHARPAGCTHCGAGKEKLFPRGSFSVPPEPEA